MRKLVVWGLLAIGASVGLSAPSDAAGPEELRKLYILMVFDTVDMDLGPSLISDQKRMTKLWQATIPADRYSLTVLTGKQVTGEKIFDHYKKLKGKITPKDGLVFFFGLTFGRG